MKQTLVVTDGNDTLRLIEIETPEELVSSTIVGVLCAYGDEPYDDEPSDTPDEKETKSDDEIADDIVVDADDEIADEKVLAKRKEQLQGFIANKVIAPRDVAAVVHKITGGRTSKLKESTPKELKAVVKHVADME